MRVGFFIRRHLGKLLLAAAVVWFALAGLLNLRAKRTFDKEGRYGPAVRDEGRTRKGQLQYPALVRVPFADAPIAEGAELQARGREVRGREEYLFVKERKFKPFEPVNVPAPGASIPRPPQLLPSPGPNLQGSDKLPRWGEEAKPLPEPVLEPPKEGAEKQ
jgi:hypothetical protein